MIKIEFNKPFWNPNDSSVNMFRFFNYEEYECVKNNFIPYFNEFKGVTKYIPTQDTYLDRSFILQQLGISKEQDEEMQQKYK